MIEFKLPDVGEGIHEGEIGKWLIKEGERVACDQPIVEVLTDKVNAELTAPAGGVVRKLMFAEGDAVRVGEVLFVLEAEGRIPVEEAGKAEQAALCGCRGPSASARSIRAAGRTRGPGRKSARGPLCSPACAAVECRHRAGKGERRGRPHYRRGCAASCLGRHCQGSGRG